MSPILVGLSIFFVVIPMVAIASPIDLPVKWSQPPDMVFGIDYLSMHRVTGPVVVDDFRSNGMPIVGFHWWGSYFQNDPNLGPTQDRNVQFEISFHPDVPAGNDPNYTFSTPGQPYQFQLVTAEESFFGTTQSQQRVYEYWALLNTPWTEVAGNIYWVDFAWVAGQFNTDPSGIIWGLHESSVHWNDSAVTTNPPSPGGNPHLGPWMLVGVGQRDMAFEVLGQVPEPSTMLLIGSGLLGLAGYGRKKFFKK